MLLCAWNNPTAASFRALQRKGQPGTKESSNRPVARAHGMDVQSLLQDFLLFPPRINSTNTHILILTPAGAEPPFIQQLGVKARAFRCAESSDFIASKAPLMTPAPHWQGDGVGHTPSLGLLVLAASSEPRPAPHGWRPPSGPSASTRAQALCPDSQSWLGLPCVTCIFKFRHPNNPLLASGDAEA